MMSKNAPVKRRKVSMVKTEINPIAVCFQPLVEHCAASSIPTPLAGSSLICRLPALVDVGGQPGKVIIVDINWNLIGRAAQHLGNAHHRPGILFLADLQRERVAHGQPRLAGQHILADDDRRLIVAAQPAPLPSAWG
jgi:hypothetical protein